LHQSRTSGIKAQEYGSAGVLGQSKKHDHTSLGKSLAYGKRDFDVIEIMAFSISTFL
jgi:hypothetical protein